MIDSKLRACLHGKRVARGDRGTIPSRVEECFIKFH